MRRRRAAALPRRTPRAAPLPRVQAAPHDPTRSDVAARRAARARHARPGRPDARGGPRHLPGRARTFFDALLKRLGEDPQHLNSLRYAAGGLRAGSYAFTTNHARLRGLVYVPGVQVSGRLSSVSILPDGLLRVRGHAAAGGTLRVHNGVMSGRLGGHHVRGRLGPDIFDLAYDLLGSQPAAVRASLASRTRQPARMSAR